jgi:hypothetical protein
MGSIKDFKYKKINNFISGNELDLIRVYLEVRHRNNYVHFDWVQSNNFDTGIYGDPLTDSLLHTKVGKMSEICGLQLIPTYSFWRMYTTGAILKEHSDRPSCEVSVTINIGTSEKEPWPIYMENNPVDLNPGDAVVYLGCELNHKRDEFKGEWNSQVFLHYVDANGPNRSFELDGRNTYGESKPI